MRWCKKLALKVALTMSFVLTAMASYLLPSDFHVYILAAGAAQNAVWLWEV